MSFFDYSKTPIRKECICGQQKDGRCTVRIAISGAGVISQTGSGLVACGLVKKQIEKLKRVKTEGRV